ncbi:MAG TPA: family 16 glycoside hydrolase [Ktedonobacterales bacterium]|nr:family 16 glycoside hydrolase [Ktedonobacterales bacterium]
MWGSYPPYAPPAPAKQGSRLKWILLASALVVVLAASGIAGTLAVANWWVGHAATATGATATATTAQGTATATPSGFFDFTDPLTSNVYGWAENGYCSFHDGAYHVTGGYVCYAPAEQFSDFDMHVTVEDASGTLNSGYGLVFRATDAKNYYAFVVAALGAAWVIKYVNGQPYYITPYWTPPTFTFVPGHGHHATLRLVAHGSSFTCYVNGVEAGTVNDSTFTRGKVGLISGGDDLDAVFSNFEVAGAP